MAEPGTRGSYWKLQRPSLDTYSDTEKAINAPQKKDKNEFRSSGRLLANFCLMSFAFSANHATVVALVGIAGAIKTPAQNGAIQATLYSVYTLASLLFANFFIVKLGSKGTILFGLAMYCLYSGGFLVSHFLTEGSTAHWVVTIGATALSGLGAGGLWTAQASFFSSTAKQHARITGCTIESANAYFSSVFVVFYLGFEVLMRIISSLVNLKKAKMTLYIIYTGVAVGAAFLMSFVRPVQQMDDSVKRVPILQKITAAGKMAVTDPRIMLLAPYNFTFGFASAFLNSYITTQSTYKCETTMNETKSCTSSDPNWANRMLDTQGADIVPPDWIGWFGASLVVSALIFSTACGFVIKHTTVPKLVPMVLGSLFFIAFAMFFVINPGQEGNETMHGKYVYLVPIYVFFGCGRGIWESTMKAVFADFFGGNPATSGAAFANIPLQNGLSGAAGYILFTQVTDPREVGKWLVIVIGVIGIITYIFANQIDKRIQREASANKEESRALITSIGEED